jgi:DNA-binding response OmpR family regulator
VALMRALDAVSSSGREPWLRPDPPEGSLHPVAAHAGHVLLVDDDPHHRIPLLRALRRKGHAVLHAADGASGELLCRTSTHQLAALIACADMKRMDGFELALRVGRMRPEVRVLLMGRTSAAREDARRARERGYEVIEAPFTPEDLCARLTELLGAGADNETQPVAMTGQ